jgi:hypothetical protein
MRSLISLLLTFFSLVPAVLVSAQKISPVDIVKGQLDAYNNQNIETFLSWYSEDVEVYNFPCELIYKGKDKMREKYTTAWAQNPKQKAEVTNRISAGGTVIDNEHVTGRSTGIEANVIAIYKTVNGKIKQVYFIRE